MKTFHKIILATGNPGKLNEYRQILTGVDFFTAKELGLPSDYDETGQTFAENAAIKARTIGIQEDSCVIADDSGLCIDALNGEPGVFSSRYMGESTSYDIKNAELLKRLKDVPDNERGARFVCAIAAVTPEGELIEVQAAMEGSIAYEPAGENGFGYDPIFYLPERGCTSAQLSPEEKNAISHRGKAVRELNKTLAKLQGLVYNESDCLEKNVI